MCKVHFAETFTAAMEEYEEETPLEQELIESRDIESRTGTLVTKKLYNCFLYVHTIKHLITGIQFYCS